MKQKLSKCENCKGEIYDIGRGYEGHFWWCKIRDPRDVQQDLAKKLDQLLYHLGIN